MSCGRVAIVGAGISGLTLGYWLKKANVSVTLFESSGRVGGYMGSERDEDFVVERGPNSLLDSTPAFQSLIKELGLKDRVTYAQNNSKERFLYLEKKLKKLPRSFFEFLKSDIVETPSKFRIISEFVKSFSHTDTQETIFEFATRHFGNEIAYNIVIPATIGVFAGDARDLNFERAFPKLQKIEEQYGSVLRGMMKTKSAAKLFSFQNGTQELVDALYENLKNEILLNTPVTSFQSSSSGWSVNGHIFERVILCTSLPSILKTVANLQNQWPKLKKKDVAPVVSVSLGFNLPLSTYGFGILIHPDNNLKTLGILFPSNTFKNRAPQNSHLLTLIMGGTFHPEVTTWTSEHLITVALSELRQILGPIPDPVKTWTFNYPEGITQYNSQSSEDFDMLKRQIQNQPGLYVNSHAFGGVAVGDCVYKSYELARSIAPRL